MVAGSYRRSRDHLAKPSKCPALGRVSRGPAGLGQVPVPGTWTCPAEPWSGDLGVEIVVAADLLVPPLGLAALQRALSLSDVCRELVFLGTELLLELGDRLLAGLELVEPDLEVGLVPRLALVELLLPVVELLRALAQVRLGLRQPLLALADAGESRLRDLGLLGERGLALGELLL